MIDSETGRACRHWRDINNNASSPDALKERFSGLGHCNSLQNSAAYLACSFRTAPLAVSGESGLSSFGAFLTGANSSLRSTSRSAVRWAFGNGSNMNCSSLIPCNFSNAQVQFKQYQCPAVE